MREFDTLIVGGGPAGCTCALWLAQMGLHVAVLERQAVLLPTLKALDFPQSWVISHAHASLREVATDYETQVRKQANIAFFLNVVSCQPLELLHGQNVFRLNGGKEIGAKALVVATGQRPRQLPSAVMGVRAEQGGGILDAVTLTQTRASITGQRVLLLGSGDNAAENALALAAQGNTVVVWARSRWRAQRRLVAVLSGWANISCRLPAALPSKICKAARGFEVHSAHYAVEQFDVVASLLGFVPELGFWHSLVKSAAWPGGGVLSTAIADHAADPRHGIFVAGDLSARMHPCVQTALADGVVVARQVQAYLQA